MKLIISFFAIFLTLNSSILFAGQAINFNKDWKFRKQADKWEKVNLPHTAHIEPYISNDMWMGTALYQKEFKYDKAWNGKKVFVEFEGAMTVAKVKLNGKLLTTHLGGYVGFEVDLTDHLNKSGKNLLEVELDNTEKPNIPPGKPYKTLDFAWFSGLCRNVNLKVKSPLYITNPVTANKPASGGTFVTYPEITEKQARIAVKTHVFNDFAASKEFAIKQTLYLGKQKISEILSKKAKIDSKKDAAISQAFSVKNPQLWSPTAPNLYTLKTAIVVNGKEIDSETQKIGLRAIKIAGRKFYINGKQMYLRGTNRHQEFPYVGYAASDNAQYRDAQMIKEAGFDIVRLSHYPQSPAFYRACDELGLMVIDCVSGWQWFKKGDFAKRSLQEAREMIRRDRNHPSVIMWETSLNESGMPDWFLKKMHEIVDEEYPGDQSLSISFKGKYHDVFGPARQHTKGPEFWDDWQKGEQTLFTAEYGDWEYFSSMAANFNQAGAKELKKDEATSRQLRKHGEKRLLQMALNYQESHNQNLSGKSIIGDANWLMFDYNRGYANDHCTSGIMDLMRLPKFAYYFYQSQRPAAEKSELFKSGPMVFAATYWNKKSSPKVRVFSNCEEVVAYLNGKKVARQKPDSDIFSTNINQPPFTFDFGKFAAGELKFVGLIDGKEVVVHSVKTPGKPVALNLFVDKHAKPLKADKGDFVFVYASVVDKNGTVVPDAENKLQFQVKGANVLGPKSINAEAGINGILVGKVAQKGKVSISVSSDGLKADQFVIKAE